MKNKLLSNLSHLLCAALGFLHLIFLLFPYAAAFVSFLGAKESEGINGYKFLGMWSAGFAGVMCSLFQLLLLIFTVAMLLYGTYNLLRNLNIINFSILPEQLCSKVFSRYALFGYTGMNFLLMIFLIIFCASNTTSGIGGIRIGIGIFFAILSGAGAIIADILFAKNSPATDTPIANVSYTCTQCGKVVRKGVRFCPQCGGSIQEKIVYPTIFVCSSCGKRAKAGVKFCPDCGGGIVETVPTVTVHVCVNCGKQAKPGVNFCAECGGKIETREVNAV